MTLGYKDKTARSKNLFPNFGTPLSASTQSCDSKLLAGRQSLARKRRPPAASQPLKHPGPRGRPSRRPFARAFRASLNPSDDEFTPCVSKVGDLALPAGLAR